MTLPKIPTPRKPNVFLAIISSFLILTLWPVAMNHLGFYKPADNAHSTHSPTEPHETSSAYSFSPLKSQIPSVPQTSVDTTPTLMMLQDDHSQGTFNRRGGIFDNLVLLHYHESTDPGSPAIRLLSSEPNQRYTVAVGWQSPNKTLELPTPETLWNQDTPNSVSWKNPQGVTFRQVIERQDTYLFKVSQIVTNTLEKPIHLSCTGHIHRQNPPSTGSFLLHEGDLGVFDGILKEASYSALEGKAPTVLQAQKGWVGVTDKYWLSAIAPVDSGLTAHFYHRSTSGYHVTFSTPLTMLNPGESFQQVSWVFLGPKELHVLEAYEKRYAIDRLHLAVDFGWFYFLTKPLFIILAFFKSLTGNFGSSILLLTLMLSLLFLPLAARTYRTQGRLKRLQPKIHALQTTYAKDPARLNQEIFKLYRTEQVNPVSGCLPMLIQIPVFAALYKVLFVTLEMRHAPFMGWIKDLSAPDPYNLLNLMGLIPWNPPFSLGVLPVIMGCSLFLQQKLNPAPQDPLQAKMFLYGMPLIVTFSLANFPSGLLIYWIGRNILTILQQTAFGRWGK